MVPSTWIVIGASRGIGLELVRQLLEKGNQVIAAVRTPSTANEIWQLAAKQLRPAACLIEQCDVTKEASIDVSWYQWIPTVRKARYCVDGGSLGICHFDEEIGGQRCTN